jgi:putative radical SAM enzyme (TIGR03279 family)
MEIEAGDVLVSVNGKEIEDVFDFHYAVNDEYLELLIRKADGEEWELEIEKEYNEDLGIEFENGLMDDYKSCTNKCIFCFIDQMPPGMRETLYFKDDDSRLSFLQGNYVTLTNMKDKDLDRIIQYHMGPINISVQTTNPELRCMMLHNRFAGDSLKKIDRLYEAGIPMNGQIVLCKGVNDGEELERSIRELTKYLPCMESVSVVPVGLSKYREGLYPLEPFTKEDAIEIIEEISSLQEEFLKDKGSRIVYIADEIYILSEKGLPQSSYYEDFPQIENGVGMMSSFLEEALETLEEKENIKSRKTIVTGELAYPYFKELARKISEKSPDLKINVVMGKNKLFGERITVTGLLCGRDIIDSLKGIDIGDALLLSDDTLRAEKDLFLDDMTVCEMEEIIGTKVLFNANNGKDFIDKIFS